MIKLVKSSFYKEEEVKIKLAKFVIDSEVLSMGEECRKYEIAFADKYKRKYAVFVSNGSAANLALIQAFLNLGMLKQGDKIGFSALTWATNVMPIIQLGLKPVAIDCELDTLNVSPDTLAPHIADLKGLFITNVLGFSDNIQQIANISKENGILFFEDNCEALGSEAYGKLLGNFGIASTFSFFVGHHLSTIEGGMIVTDDEELYKMLVMVRAHGWDRNLSDEIKNELRSKLNIDEFYAKYTFYDLAYNLRPTELNGFIGNATIDSWEEIITRRENNYKKFVEAINQNEDCYQFNLAHMERVSNMAMPVVFKSKDLFLKYKERFEKNEIEIRPLIAGNMTRQPFYRKYFSEKLNLPNSDIVHEQGLYFPNNPELTEEEVNKITKLFF